MAELAKLLGFMSSWDRQATLDRYEAMFDEGGDPEAVMGALGSPTKVAVELAKGYVSSPAPGEAVDRDMPEIEVVSLEQLLAEAEAGEEAEAEADPLPTEPEPFRAPPAPTEIEVPAAPAREAAEPVWEEGPEELPPVRTGGAAFAAYCVLAVLIGLPVTVLLFCIGVPFLAAGAAVIVSVVTTVPGTLSSFSLLSDVLLLSGGGLALLGLGLLLAWFGLWLGLTLCRLWILKLILPLGKRLRDGEGARDA